MKGDEKEGGEEMGLETENTVESDEKVEPIKHRSKRTHK
jgi:hypothetical protein